MTDETTAAAIEQDAAAVAAAERSAEDAAGLPIVDTLRRRSRALGERARKRWGYAFMEALDRARRPGEAQDAKS